MNTENIITWNATNWLTILLMAAIGFAVLGFGIKAVKRYVPQANIGG